jgi:hypothetical protein
MREAIREWLCSSDLHLTIWTLGMFAAGVIYGMQLRKR